MLSLTALILLSMTPVRQDATPPQQTSVDRLVTDLGASDPQARERAEVELRKRGREAVPALRNAARSDNAERAMRARALLIEMAHNQSEGEEKDRPTPGQSPAPRIALVYEDWTQGIRYVRRPDGSVELRVPEKQEGSDQRQYQTYRAASMEEFKKKYPELVEKYNLDKLLSVREVPPGDRQLRQWLGLDEPSEQGEESEGRRFGIVVSPVGRALSSHLGLRDGEGLIVRQVEPGSLAEKSGLKPYDVIAKLNGEKTHARAIEEFRKRLQEAMGTDKFSLDLIRNGKHETVQVTPTKDKDEKKVK